MTTKNVFSLFCTFHVCFSILLYGQTTKEHADTIITGGTVVTMDGQRHIYDDGAIVVTGDSIVAVDVSQAIGQLKTVRPDGELVRTARAIGIGFGD